MFSLSHMQICKNDKTNKDNILMSSAQQMKYECFEVDDKSAFMLTS